MPVKLNEYLAAGKPVVSTELPYVKDFNQRYDVLMTVAPQPEVFLKAIEQSLSFSRDAAQITRRLEVAGGNDWESRLEAMSELIETQMRAKAVPGKKQDG